MKQTVVIFFLAISFGLFAQQKTNKLTLHFDNGFIPHNFFKSVHVHKGDSLIGKWAIEPFRHAIGIPYVENTDYELTLFSQFGDSITRQVDLSIESQDIQIDNIYNEISISEMKELMSKAKRLFVYQLEAHTVSGELSSYTLSNADIRLDYKLGSILIDKNGSWGEHLGYRFMTFKFDEKLDEQINSLMTISCPTTKVKKRKKKYDDRFLNIILFTEGKFVIMDYCDDRKAIFENMVNWIEENKTDIYEH